MASTGARRACSVGRHGADARKEVVAPGRRAWVMPDARAAETRSPEPEERERRPAKPAGLVTSAQARVLALQRTAGNRATGLDYFGTNGLPPRVGVAQP